MHIESSMTTPVEFSRTTLPYGVTTVVADAHEIANVFGMEGIKSFMSQKTEQDIFWAIPSSVPATNEELETPELLFILRMRRKWLRIQGFSVWERL